MSENTFAIVITSLLVLAIVLWVPFLHLCCRCKASLFSKERHSSELRPDAAGSASGHSGESDSGKAFVSDAVLRDSAMGHATQR
jgi:hypothetical protein